MRHSRDCANIENTHAYSQLLSAVAPAPNFVRDCVQRFSTQQYVVLSLANGSDPIKRWLVDKFPGRTMRNWSHGLVVGVTDSTDARNLLEVFAAVFGTNVVNNPRGSYWGLLLPGSTPPNHCALRLYHPYFNLEDSQPLHNQSHLALRASAEF